MCRAQKAEKPARIWGDFLLLLQAWVKRTAVHSAIELVPRGAIHTFSLCMCLLCPWNSPGRNTEVGSHSLLQGIFSTQGLNLDLPHFRQILYHLSHQGNPVYLLLFFFIHLPTDDHLGCFLNDLLVLNLFFGKTHLLSLQVGSKF